jgi:transketolase
LAKTVKGKGVSFLEGKSGWHGRALTKDELSKALNELPEQQFPEVSINSPERLPEKPSKTIWLQKKNYSIGQQISTRESFGDALAFTVGADPDLVVLDAEVGNSTFTEKSKEVDPSRFFQTYIAEQNMIGIAQGLSAKGLKPVSATFAAFLSRAHDQIRMSAVSESSMIICGSHAGISMGKMGHLKWAWRTSLFSGRFLIVLYFTLAMPFQLKL